MMSKKGGKDPGERDCYCGGTGNTFRTEYILHSEFNSEILVTVNNWYVRNY